MLENLNPQKASLALFVIAAATLVGAWIFQFAGYDPCHLCLQQRWPYYFAIPFSLLLSVSAGKTPKGARRGLYLLAFRILGISLAGWKARIAAALAVIALAGARHQGSSSVSQ